MFVVFGNILSAGGGVSGFTISGVLWFFPGQKCSIPVTHKRKFNAAIKNSFNFVMPAIFTTSIFCANQSHIIRLPARPTIVLYLVVQTKASGKVAGGGSGGGGMSRSAPRLMRSHSHSCSSKICHAVQPHSHSFPFSLTAAISALNLLRSP